MSTKKDFSSALRATSTQQKAVIEDRFSRADSVLLNPSSAGAAAVAVAVAVVQAETVAQAIQLVTRDTFSMPSEEHAIIEKLRLIAAKENVLVNKSEIARCALQLLGELNTTELIARLAALKKGKPGRR